MTDSRLTVRDRELFFAEPYIAALSVSAGRDRGPLTLPIWYQYAPGGEAWVLTESSSLKARLIEAAGRSSRTHNSVVSDYCGPVAALFAATGPQCAGKAFWAADKGYKLGYSSACFGRLPHLVHDHAFRADSLPKRRQVHTSGAWVNKPHAFP